MMKSPSQLPKRIRNALKKIKNVKGNVSYEFNCKIYTFLGIRFKFKFGRKVDLKHNCLPQYGDLIKKNTCFIHPIGLVIYYANIGRNNIIFQNVTIGGKSVVNSFPEDYPTIGDNCIVFAGASILGGVTIGNNVIVGAGAVVVSNVPDNCVVAGNPAKIIKRGIPNNDNENIIKRFKKNWRIKE